VIQANKFFGGSFLDMSKQKKYVIVGASSRGIQMYALPIAEKYGEVAKLAGIYDPNTKRAEFLKKKAGNDFPVYKSFDEMINESKPDAVIVTPVDRYHHEYIIKSLKAGITAITEKPMTIDAQKCNEILETEKQTGKSVKVTFNARCSPLSTKVKKIVSSNMLGKIYSVHFEWMLDTVHGADYFRRWHRKMDNSGGLLVHKSTHHFDMINWFIGQDPETVTAYGALNFYGPTRNQRGERCFTCKYKDTCSFYFNIEQPQFKELYLDCEDVDGYFRDKCVFSDEIDIYDTVSMNVKYSAGTTMSYSLNAHSPYEGYKLAINGSEGRLEAENNDQTTFNTYEGTNHNSLRLYNRDGEEISFKLPSLPGTHDGGDDILQEILFKENHPDPMGYAADSRAGAMSLIIGAAANLSIKKGTPINRRDILDI
jgi:predicted dehydrogenase